MHDQLIEKFAALFGECATTGDIAPLQKEAAAHALVKEAFNPLIAGALGAGVGGASGYFGTEKKKNKTRNAIYGALAGGLGSAGLAQFLGTTGQKLPTLFGRSDAAGAGGVATDPRAWDYTTDGTGYEGATIRNGTGTLLGAAVGQRLGAAAVDRAAPNNGRTGELKRLADSYESGGGGKGKGGTGGGRADHGRVIREIIEAERVNPGRGVVLPGQTLGPNNRAQAAANLAREMSYRLNKLKPPLKNGQPPRPPAISGTGTLLDDLDGVRGTKLRTTARGLGGSAGGLAGGLVANYGVGYLQNILANALGLAPKPAPAPEQK